MIRFGLPQAVLVAYLINELSGLAIYKIFLQNPGDCGTKKVGRRAAAVFSVTMTGALEQQLQTERQEAAQDAVYRVNGVSHTSGKRITCCCCPVFTNGYYGVAKGLFFDIMA